MKKSRNLLFALALFASACSQHQNQTNEDQTASNAMNSIAQKLSIYKNVTLTSDLSSLSANDKQMLVHFIKAAQLMDELFWEQAYGDKASLMASITDSATRALVEINYGPWDRMDDNKPFVTGIGEKPLGANYYPVDMTKAEFEAFEDPNKTSLYTTFIRDIDTGKLMTIFNHNRFGAKLKLAAEELIQAAALATDANQKKYLELRAKALLDDDYMASDIAWLDMKENIVDIVIGPIETYEDALFGNKASYESYVLVKDVEWSKRLAHYATLLPALQKGLPVDEKYKQESPGTDSELNAYDVVFYAGDCNAGGKTIAVNLPNDETIQNTKGTRRSQLKNAMRAKFDHIMVPIANELIDAAQRQYVTFDAFFENTMFHEVAHGLGIKNTINGKGTVREALQEKSSALEEGKADILGLYMITMLNKMGELPNHELKTNYTTFLAGIFRSVRFGAASDHGIANMIRFNFFAEKGAFTRDETTGTYKVDFDKMNAAMNELSALIITLQGTGDLAAVNKLVADKGVINSQLKADLERLSAKAIPVDVVFTQGLDVLGLQ